MLTPSNVSRATFNNAIKANNPTHVRITAVYENTTYTLTDDDVLSSGISIRTYLNSDTDLTIGKSVSKEVSFKLIRTSNAQNAVLYDGFTVEIGVETGNDIGWVNLGKFYPIDDDSEYYDDNIINVVAYDCMNKFDVPADAWLQSLIYPMTLSDMFTSLCSYVGLTGEIGDALYNISTRSFSEAPIENTGLLCRDVLELIAEACGCFAKITPDEHCKLVWFYTTHYNITEDEIFDFGAKKYLSQISGLNVRNTEDDVGVLYPANANAKNLYVIVDNPFLVTANSTEETNYIKPLAKRLRNFAHRPFTMTSVGNPLIEAGDTVSRDLTVYYVYVKEMLWNGGCTDFYQSTGNMNRKTYTSAVRQKLSIGGRYHIFKNDIDQLYSEIADAEDSITLVDQKADNIALSAGKKARMWYSNTAPTGTTSEPLVANVDYWINTSDNRKLMRWTGSAWAAADDISKYTKYSGIDINQNGVDITGSKYVKIRSGGVFALDTPNLKIDSSNNEISCCNWKMNWSGLVLTNINAGLRISHDSWASGETKTPIKIATGDEEGIFGHDQGLYIKLGFTDSNDKITGIKIQKQVAGDYVGIIPTHSGISVGSDDNPFSSARIHTVNSNVEYTKKISFKGTKATTDMIRFLDNTVDAYGNGIAIGGGGVVVIGAGESASTNPYGAGHEGEENLYLMADSVVRIITNVQDSNNQKLFLFGTDGVANFPGDILALSGIVKATHIYKGNTELQPNTWRGFQVKQYQYTYTIAANSSLQIPASSFLGNSAPSGYTPVAISYFNTSDSNVEVFYLDATATGNAAMVVLQNRANAQISHPMAIKILYLQN